MQRRRFLLLLGDTATGIVIAGGFIALPGKMVLAVGGRCSFCGRKGREVFGLAGVLGRSCRVCDQCVSLCLELLSEEDRRERGESTPPETRLKRESTPEEIAEFIAALPIASLPGNAEFESEWRELVEALAERGAPLDTIIEPKTDPVRSRRQEFDEKLAHQKKERQRFDAAGSLACSFCDAPKEKAKKLIAGPTTYICDACIVNAAVTLRVYHA